MPTATALKDLHQWTYETRQPLPRDAFDIACIELANGIVELATGDYFVQTDNWTDFTHRWAAEQARRGRALDPNRLADAIYRANANHYQYPLCLQIAITTLRALAQANHVEPAL